MKKTTKDRLTTYFNTEFTREKTIAAAIEYLKRENRTAHPTGKFDNAKRFYPSDMERCDCCYSIRTPSASWPNTLMNHCRSAKHIANKFKVDVLYVNRLVKLIRENNIDHSSADATRNITALLIDTSIADDAQRIRSRRAI